MYAIICTCQKFMEEYPSLMVTTSSYTDSYTPRLFPVSFRGSATGIASALSRLAGMTAPIMTGVLLAFSTSLPLYIAAGLLFASAGFMLALP